MRAHAFHAALAGFIACAALIGSAPAAAQAPVAMKLTINVSGRSETLRGTGRCAHEPHASIYGRSAALWSANYVGAQGGPRVSLSYWRPTRAGAVDEFTLTVSSGRTSHTISTIAGQPPVGKGQSTFRATALGGRFELRGTARDGASMQVTIECARFGGIYAEGG